MKAHPNAIPLFSMKVMRNQSVTTMLSWSVMWVLTQIFTAWSMIRKPRKMRTTVHRWAFFLPVSVM